MDFREAVMFLLNHFDHEPTGKLLNVADALVVATAPWTADRAAADVFDPIYHPERKINFIKDIRNRVARATGTPCGLKEAKDAAEKFLQEYSLGLLRDKLTEPDEDEDGSAAFARHRESLAETGTWFGAPGPLDEEPF